MPEEEQKNSLINSYDSKANFEKYEDEELWGGLSKKNENEFRLIEAGEEENEVENKADLKSMNHKSTFQPIIVNQIEKPAQSNLLNSQSVIGQSKKTKLGNALLDSMKSGLGAKQEFNFKEQDLLKLQFDTGKEKRLAFFLRETEEVFVKSKELSKLNLDEIKRLKDKYLSLFYVLTLQHLQALNQNSFKLYYEKRPGCLDRLVKEVRNAKANYSFSDYEFFFKLKFL